MRQSYHSIIKPAREGVFIGWVEEVPGTMTAGRSLDEVRANLKESLRLMVETRRHEARLALDVTCLQEAIEIETDDVEANSNETNNNESAHARSAL